MNPRAKSIPLLVPAFLCMALTAAGCGESSVRVPASSGSAQVPQGGTLQVDFGYASASVGDSWSLVGKPDRGVLKDLGYDIDTESDAPGSGGDATWRFEGLTRGRTTIRLQYCFQSRPPDCEGHNKPAPKPVEIAVTVE